MNQFLQQQPEEEEWQEREQVEEVVREEAVQEELPEEERVTIRLKFLNETQKEVEASLVENLGQFKRRNFTQVVLCNSPGFTTCTCRKSATTRMCV